MGFRNVVSISGIAPLEESMQRRSLKLVEFDLKEAITPPIQNFKNSHNG
jgi:hypothetical protein